MKSLQYMNKYIEIILQSNSMKILMPSNINLPEEELKFGFGLNCMGKPDINAIQAGFLAPTNDLLIRPRKMWRPVSLLMIAECLGCDIHDKKNNNELFFSIALCEMIHNASLILDDVEKNAATRRGDKCIHHKFGLDVALNSGSLLYFRPLSLIFQNIKTNSSQYYQICIDELTRIHIGQCLDIQWNKTNTIPSEEEYLYMIFNKPSVVSRLGVRLLCSIFNLNEKDINLANNAIKFGESIGASYQIMEDYRTITNYIDSYKKGQIENIKLEQKTLMLVDSYSKLSDINKHKLLNKGNYSKENISEVIDLLNSTGSIQYAKHKASQLTENAWNQLKPLLKDCTAKEEIPLLLKHLLE